MQAALKLTATVLPDNKIEISVPELKAGDCVDVILILPETPDPQAGGAPRKFNSVVEFLDSLPQSPSPRLFSTWEEYEQHRKAERDAWDR